MSQVGEILLPRTRNEDGERLVPDFHAYGAAINEAWGSTIRGIIRTGELLAEAKAACNHGEWLTFIEDFAPFGGRMAQRLIKIASHERISNAYYNTHLPSNTDALASLANLSVDEFDAALEAGVINPTLERRKAQRLARGGLAAVLELDPNGATVVDNDGNGGDAFPDDEAEDTAYAESLIERLFRLDLDRADDLSIEARAAIVCAARAFGIAAGDLWIVDAIQGERRLRALTARRVAVCLMHTVCGLAQPAAGRPFGLEPSAVSRLASGFEDWRESETWNALLDSVTEQAQAVAAYWRGRCAEPTA